jgi:hypothetical protein
MMEEFEDSLGFSHVVLPMGPHFSPEETFRQDESALLYSAIVAGGWGMGEYGAIVHYNAPTLKRLFKLLPCLPLGQGIVGSGLCNAKADHYALPYL